MKSYFENQRGEVYSALQIKIDQFKKIIEIGCGNAVIERTLSTDQFYLGLDMIHTETKVLDSGHQLQYVDLEGQLSIPIEFHSPNLIIANDVIEHVTNPLDLLRQISDIMSDDSIFIGSIPNFLYVENLMDILLSRDFKYRSEGGILDEGHLRFYSRKSIVRLFLSSGFKIEAIVPINGFFSTDRLRNKTALPFLNLLKLLSTNFAGDFFALQWAFRVRKNN